MLDAQAPPRELPIPRVLGARRAESPDQSGQAQLLLHGHCHQKALIGTGPSLTVLRLPPGFEVEEVDFGCCGMAGSFGCEREHDDMSKAIGTRQLFPAVEATLKATNGDFDVVAAGVSCRQQAEPLTGKCPKPLVEVLAEPLSNVWHTRGKSG